MVLQQKPYKVIGTRPIRPDGADKVTGRAQFGADVQVYGDAARPRVAQPAGPRPHHQHRHEAGRGVGWREGSRQGEDLPTARDVVEEMGEAAANLRDLSHNVLAQDKVVYRGQAVAAVAATSPHIALEALSLIEVEYEPLPPVLDVREAMRPEAPLIKETQRTKSMAGLSENPSNVASTFTLSREMWRRSLQRPT